MEAFAQSVRNAKHTIALCPVCQNLTEGDGLCPICASDKRDGSVICVVADPKDVIAMERAREYNGRYHVLHGVLSIYFDLFTGCIQALVFCMLTMVYVGAACPPPAPKPEKK